MNRRHFLAGAMAAAMYSLAVKGLARTPPEVVHEPAPAKPSRLSEMYLSVSGGWLAPFSVVTIDGREYRVKAVYESDGESLYLIEGLDLEAAKFADMAA